MLCGQKVKAPDYGYKSGASRYDSSYEVNWNAAYQRYDIFKLKSRGTVVASHDRILRNIWQLTCNEWLRQSKFGSTPYTEIQGRFQKMYRMTKSGMYEDKVVNLLRRNVVRMSGICIRCPKLLYKKGHRISTIGRYIAVLLQKTGEKKNPANA
jgi:hypothetical protein